MSAVSATAGTAAPSPAGLSRWTLWFGGLAFFTCYLGQVVLGVIQPTIASELGLSESEAQQGIAVLVDGGGDPAHADGGQQVADEAGLRAPGCSNFCLTSIRYEVESGFRAGSDA